ncbi:MAG: calcium-binding protein [Cocleimonas sp.]|nr:calcium-binding protein [Cocleimonas sp.]
MTERNEEIEKRIDYDIVVDAYNEEERAMGWYYYIADNCNFPFQAKCREKQGASPLSLGEKVEVIDIASGEDCENRILVEIKWKDCEFSVPLEQLEAIDVDDDTLLVLGDWAYWCEMGYGY